MSVLSDVCGAIVVPICELLTSSRASVTLLPLVRNSCQNYRDLQHRSAPNYIK